MELDELQWATSFFGSSFVPLEHDNRWGKTSDVQNGFLILSLFCGHFNKKKTSRRLCCCYSAPYQCNAQNVAAPILWIGLLWKPLRLCNCSAFHFSNAAGMVCTYVYFGQWYLGHITENESWHWSDTAKGWLQSWIHPFNIYPCSNSMFLGLVSSLHPTEEKWKLQADIWWHLSTFRRSQEGQTIAAP